MPVTKAPTFLGFMNHDPDSADYYAGLSHKSRPLWDKIPGMQLPPQSSRAKTTMVVATIGALVLVPAVLLAQAQGKTPAQTPPAAPAVPTPGKTLHMATKIGSFKLLPKGEELPGGTLTIKFTGSLLISGIEGNGTVTPSGSIRREYYDQKHNKQVWYGTGSIVLNGTFKNAEWFGQDMEGTFTGHGYLRLYGEFAKDKTTGDYWFQADSKFPWLPSGSGVPVPQELNLPPGYTNPPPSATAPKKKGG
jgi:hypothetical protein